MADSHALRSVLFLAASFPPENVIGAHRPGRFARHLPKFGYQPYVVTSSPQPTRVPEVMEVSFQYNLVERLLLKTVFPNDDRITWTRPAEKAGASLIERHRIGVIFSTSPPFSVHLAALRLQQRYNLGWVADFRDPLVGNFVRTAKSTQLIDRSLERSIARHADAVILNTEALARTWCGRYPAWRDKFSFIYNGYDPEENFGPLPVPPRDHQRWIHAGSIYLNRYPERLLEAMDRLTAKGSLAGVRLRMVGEVGNPKILSNSVVERLTSRGVLDWTPRHIALAEARREIAEADRTIVFDHYHPDGNLQVPAKLFDYVRVGRPILAFTSPGAPLDSVLELAGIRNIRIYDQDPPAEIDRKLIEFANLPDGTQLPSEGFTRLFEAENQTRRLAGIFDRLAAPD